MTKKAKRVPPAVRVLTRFTEDVQALAKARTALLATPDGFGSQRSLAHVLVVVTVNSFEAVFDALPRDDALRAAYFGLTDADLSNSVRADNMVAALSDRGLSEFEPTVRSFFRLKVTRNKFSHGNPKAPNLLRTHHEDDPREIADPWDFIRGVAVDMLTCVIRWIGFPADVSGDASYALSDLAATLAVSPRLTRYFYDASRPEVMAWRTIEAVQCAVTENRVPDPDAVEVVRIGLAGWAAIGRELPSEEEMRFAKEVLEGIPSGSPLRGASLDARVDWFLALPDEYVASLEPCDRERFEQFRQCALSHPGIEGDIGDPAIPKEVASCFLSFVLRSDEPSLERSIGIARRTRQLIPNSSAEMLFRDNTLELLAPTLAVQIRAARSHVSTANKLITALYTCEAQLREQ